jgi:hypothetical protein
LFLGLQIDVAGSVLSFHSIKGFRMSVSSAEFIRNYSHSHLSTPDYEQAGYRDGAPTLFCVGSGDIVACVALLNSDFSEEISKLFLMQLRTLAEWESIDTTPYQQFSDLVGTTQAQASINEDHAKSVYTNIINNLRDRRRRTTAPSIADISWEYVDGRYRIIDDNAFEDVVTELMRFSGAGNDKYVYKTTNGEMFSTTSVLELPPQTYPEFTYFRGEKIFFQRYNDSYTDNTSTVRKVPHPKIKDYVKSKFEYSVNHSKIRQLIIGK